MSTKSMGPVLRHLGGKEPVEVMTRTRDFNIQTVTAPDGRQVDMPADTLVAFSAVSFRELGEGSDIWEFRTMMKSEAGPVAALMYWHGEDILTVRAMSKVL